jgi:hypothetical protein
VSIRTRRFVEAAGVRSVSNRQALRLEIIRWVTTGSGRKGKRGRVEAVRGRAVMRANEFVGRLARLRCGWVVAGGRGVAALPQSEIEWVPGQLGEGWAALRRQECLPHVFWVREFVLRKLRLDLGSGERFL